MSTFTCTLLSCCFSLILDIMSLISEPTENDQKPGLGVWMSQNPSFYCSTPASIFKVSQNQDMMFTCATQNS